MRIIRLVERERLPDARRATEGRMRSDFKMFDSVRVSRLDTPARAVQGPRSPARQPRVGDRGTIVEVFGPMGEATYLVECVDANGETAWLAEFAREELEASAPPDPVER